MPGRTKGQPRGGPDTGEISWRAGDDREGRREVSGAAGNGIRRGPYLLEIESIANVSDEKEIRV